MASNKRLTIIIVTFESSLIIRSCLDKINLNKYNVFVVDNNSQDNTVDIVKNEFPKVDLIRLDQNIGYGRANNAALEKTKTEYALILNPDASIQDDDIDVVLSLMSKNQNFALASPRTFHTEEIVLENKKRVKSLGNKDSFVFTDFIIGGVMFMNMKIFNKIGFFDKNIFMFCEDNEISLRATQNDYKNIIVNNSISFHSGAGSSKKSLRTIYRRFWHLGWSKSYWKRRRKSWINTKRATLRLVIVYFLESILNILKFNIQKAVSKFAFAMGCGFYLVGLGPFNRNGKARG